MTTDNQASLELNKNPTPESEDLQFNEAALDAKHRRNLDDKSAEQGVFGKWIGSSDSSLNLLFATLLLTFIVIILVAIYCLFAGWPPPARDVIIALIALISTIIGYIMGKNTQN